MMREFEAEQFNFDSADGLNSNTLTIPSEKEKDALSYIRQFVHRQKGRAELLHGYIPESYVDSLVEIRDANSSRKLNAAVEAIGVDGEVSQSISYTDEEFPFIEVESNFAAENKLADISTESDLSSTAYDELYALQDVMQNNGKQDIVVYYLPPEDWAELAPLLDDSGILC